MKRFPLDVKGLRLRYFSYDEYKTDPSLDPYLETKSEDEIRKEYYPYWYSKMCEKYGKEKVDSTWSFEDCLDDWMVVNWAWGVERNVDE